MPPDAVCDDEDKLKKRSRKSCKQEFHLKLKEARERGGNCEIRTRFPDLSLSIPDTGLHCTNWKSIMIFI